MEAFTGMEIEQLNSRLHLSPEEHAHFDVMKKVLSNLAQYDKPLILKGGTSLFLCYGFDRFSEDLDFDCSTKLKLENTLKHSIPAGFKLNEVTTQKDTDTTSRYRIKYTSPVGPRSLKVEVSHRELAQDTESRTIHGISVASIGSIINMKLLAAHDGPKLRAKFRDLFDLDYVARHFPAAFSATNAQRLADFSNDVDALSSTYEADFAEDVLVPDGLELDDLVLSLNSLASDILDNQEAFEDRITAVPELKQRLPAQNAFYELATRAIEDMAAAGGNAREVNWLKVQDDTVNTCIREHGQDPGLVLEQLENVSPACLTAHGRESLQQQIEAAQIPLDSDLHSKTRISATLTP